MCWRGDDEVSQQVVRTISTVALEKPAVADACLRGLVKMLDSQNAAVPAVSQINLPADSFGLSPDVAWHRMRMVPWLRNLKRQHDEPLSTFSISYHIGQVSEESVIAVRLLLQQERQRGRHACL